MLIKRNSNIICCVKNNNFQLKKTFFNKKQIIKKINKELKYIDFTNEDFEKYFLFFDKKVFKKMAKTSKNNFKYSVKDFLNEINEFISRNNIELTNIEKIIKENENNEKNESNKKEQNIKRIHDKILTDYLNENNKKQINNNKLDKLNNAINNIKN